MKTDFTRSIPLIARTAILAVVALVISSADLSAAESQYLYVWAADADFRDSDFLAVIDANPQSSTYGDVLSTIEVGAPTFAHHTEHRMADDSQLFVNGFSSGRTFVVDLREPLTPAISARFVDRGQFSYPHSFERLPSGNILSTFQTGVANRRPLGDIAGENRFDVRQAFLQARGESVTTGGLVELTPEGGIVRSSSAATGDFPEIRPYSLAILPDADRVVTTSHDMWGQEVNDTVQIWQLSDLSLLHTLRLPPGPRGDENIAPAEPRLMANGETLLVSTFTCGLYGVRNVAGTSPSVYHVHTLTATRPPRPCALPVTFEDFWIQTIPARTGLVAFDMSDIDDVEEVGYVNLGENVLPHWIALEPDNRRIVVTGFGSLENGVMMVNVDANTGALSIDSTFGTGGIVNFAREDWPHGSTGSAVPHGAVFSVR